MHKLLFSNHELKNTYIVHNFFFFHKVDTVVFQLGMKAEYVWSQSKKKS